MDMQIGWVYEYGICTQRAKHYTTSQNSVATASGLDSLLNTSFTILINIINSVKDKSELEIERIFRMEK